MSLIDKIIKNGHIKGELLSTSAIYEDQEFVDTNVPVFNIVLSGRFDGGLIDGITTIAGPSRHFKSTLALIAARAYLDKYKDAIILFYDNERGMTRDYFESVGIDPERVVIKKIHNVEEFKFDLVQQLSENITVGDKVFIMVDSVGNLASKKEIDDALDEKSVADMTRAKAFKSLYRMITPYITDLKIPLVQIAHVYDEIGLFPKKIVSGGTGIMLASDTIIIIGRAQDKKGKELLGYNFKLRVEKSRFCIENTILDLKVSFKGGVRKYGGLLEIAEEGGYVKKGRVGRATGYARAHIPDDKMVYEKKTFGSEFWQPIIDETDFVEYVNNKYGLATSNIIDDAELVEETEED